jgi:hypothetical protein
MLDIIVKIIQLLIDRFASASPYIVAGFVGALLLFGLFAYFFGDQLVQPYIDDYLMTKMNSYFEEKGGLLSSARKVDKDIQNTAVERLKNITESLYDEVDAVYSISNSITRADIQKLGTNGSLTFTSYIYADLDKHRILLFLNRRQFSFDYTLCFNGNKACTERTNNLVNLDITEILKQNPLRPANGGTESERLAYPPNIHSIEITPIIKGMQEGEVASLEGYVMVKRAQATK